MTAPVQVLVIGLDRLVFDGDVLAELDRLHDAGTVRLLDVLLVSRADTGQLSTLPPPPGLPAATGSVVAELLGTPDDDGDSGLGDSGGGDGRGGDAIGLGDGGGGDGRGGDAIGLGEGGGDDGSGSATGAPADDVDAVWSLDGAIPPGRTAAVALIEHLWAEPLREAIRTAGGSPLGETWLAPEDLERLSSLLARRGPTRRTGTA